MSNITVFMGSENGNNPKFIKIAEELGKKIADENHKLIYGGSDEGLMGTVALSVMKNGGEVIGITPHNLAEEAISASEITELIDVPNMDIRKQKLISMGDVSIALPGGMGTLEEIGQVLSWNKIKLSDSPLVLLNIDGFYDGLVDFINKTIEYDFVPDTNQQKVFVASSIDEAFNLLKL